MDSAGVSERQWVIDCMTELCRNAGFASEHLAQRDVQFLCDSIESKTGVMISLSTMKRLLNGQFARQPQSATLNAIASFLGYQHWQDFKLKKQVNGNGASHHDSLQPGPSLTSASNTSHRYRQYIIIASIVILGAISCFAFLGMNRHRPIHAPIKGIGTAQFSMIKTTLSDLPNTVVFNYDIDRVKADSFFIQQSWDKDRRVKIHKGNHTLTDIYYEPGYHVAKLIANDSVIRTIDVSIPTDKWFFYARERKSPSIPEYISAKGLQEGKLAMTEEEVKASGVDIQKDHLYLQVYFPSNIQYNSSDYILHCKLRTHQLKPNFCPFLMCEVFCQRNFMYFKSTSKGCSSEMKAQFGETILNGKTTDLSALATNVNEWQDVVITVKNQNVTITINQIPVLTTSYTQSSGKLTGLGFLSNGLPEVDFVSLETLDGTKIYSNEFE